MTTETPVTSAAFTFCDVKSGDAVPVAVRVPVTEPSEAFPAPVNVTVYGMFKHVAALVTGAVVT